MKLTLILRADIYFLLLTTGDITVGTRITKGNADVLIRGGLSVCKLPDSASFATSDGIIYDDLRRFTDAEKLALIQQHQKSIVDAQGKK